MRRWVQVVMAFWVRHWRRLRDRTEERSAISDQMTVVLRKEEN